jgi:TonB family protein
MPSGRAGNGTIASSADPLGQSSSTVPRREPRLDLRRTGRWRNLAENLLALVRGPMSPKEFHGDPYFRDCWISGHGPRGAFCASVLWHVALVLLVIPLSRFVTPRRDPALPQTEITWYGPASDLLPVTPKSLLPKPIPTADTQRPPTSRGADAFHSRQTIFNTPMHPNHPRQTLIEPAAPPEPPKILPPLPNIVAWNTASQPALRIDPQELARLRPEAPAARRQAPDIPIPELPDQEQQIGALAIAAATPAEKPALPLTAMSAPRANAMRLPEAAVPEIRASDAVDMQLIALSATPGPVMPPAMPSGNLSSRLAISPNAIKSGAPDGKQDATNAGDPSGTGPAGLRISGGRVESTISGIGPRGIILPGARGRAAVEAPAAAVPAMERSQPGPLLGRMKPGMRPEELLGAKRVYTLRLNMPNLTSATGSWVLSFAALAPVEADPANPSEPPADLSGPEALKKVDPKYPPELRGEHVQGEVVLYAVIRADGSVDSIQLVSGIDPTLDENAMKALAEWKFLPARRGGTPIDLEAIVHIPFRSVAPVY